MKGRDGFIQGYNAQAAVDGAHQVIVAQSLSDNASNQAELVRLVEGIKTNTGASRARSRPMSAIVQRPTWMP